MVMKYSTLLFVSATSKDQVDGCSQVNDFLTVLTLLYVHQEIYVQIIPMKKSYIDSR